MAVAGGETVAEIYENEEKQVPGYAAKEQEHNPESDRVEEEGKTVCSRTVIKQEESEEQSSPRGVLEGQISGSDSDHSIDRTSSFGGEKSPADRREALNNGNLQWKKLFGQVKRTTTLKFSTISLLVGHDLTKKTSRKRSGRHRSTEEAADCGDFLAPKPSWRSFSYEELRQATDDFSPAKLLGKGGHAAVYKGCLADGHVVAVKKIIKKNKNEEDRACEFLSELGIIAHIDHPNAAKLIGFSADKGLHLVLQYSPHGSLATILHGSEERLGWKIRYKVAIGVAEGLQYLHHGCQRRIIHRDITASNILLSENYEAQISDFGLAKWLPEKWAHLVVSPIEGTFGYMAPEYFMHGLVHEKTDVFAFGVLLLELITGRRAVDSASRQSLVIWAKPFLEKNSVSEIADPKLGEAYNVVEMKRAMSAAAACIQHLPNKRPNMKRVVQLLKGEGEGVDMRHRLTGERALLLDSCDLDEYTSTTYLKDLNRHMELVME
ncbi:UNVERIFIED_CONTAM: Receptor-like cytosolic serine/threonine-protein kinase RBK1 [Sesamum radiatum]|uniref:non-specific serine/threonine protein kinase n=1 Tax=Sesamum radiatum TaxID=300843 RepID=A0AAW2RFF9_SESRA